MHLSSYSEQDAEAWDELAARSLTGTFIHTRRYLAYHGDRFTDVSVVIRDDGGNLVGLFPAAVDLSDQGLAVSHPGITYGGVLHAGYLRGARMIEAFAELKKYYARQKFTALRYKAVPVIYHSALAADDLYALFINDAKRYRCDLSCAIDLANRRESSSRRRRSLKKALKSGVQIDEGVHHAADLWSVLEENLASKFGARPVHTLEEITHLHSLFEGQIKFVVALLNSKVIAGVVLFDTATVAHAQYITSSGSGYEVSALDAVFDFCIEQAKTSGKRYFDFGTSNENGGRKLNETLYNFKSEFGGGGVAHEFYEINLQEG